MRSNPITDRCSYCGKAIEYLTDTRDPFWTHRDRMNTHGLIPTRPRLENVPRVELATTETGEVRPHLMYAFDRHGRIVGTAAALPADSELWLAHEIGTDRMTGELTEHTAWQLLSVWAREASS